MWRLNSFVCEKWFIRLFSILKLLWLVVICVGVFLLLFMLWRLVLRLRIICIVFIRLKVVVWWRIVFFVWFDMFRWMLYLCSKRIVFGMILEYFFMIILVKLIWFKKRWRVFFFKWFGKFGLIFVFSKIFIVLCWFWIIVFLLRFKFFGKLIVLWRVVLLDELWCLIVLCKYLCISFVIIWGWW